MPVPACHHIGSPGRARRRAGHRPGRPRPRRETFRQKVSDPAAPAFSTFTAAINDAGVVVGEYLDTSEDFHGFTEVRGVFTPVEDPLGTAGTNVAGISNLGVIVGFYVDSSGNFRRFELSPSPRD